MTLQLGIFLSGTGSNFRAIRAATLDGRLDARIRLVISNKSEAPGLTFAAEHGIPTLFESKELRASADHAAILLDILHRHEVDFIALCGYMLLVPSRIVQTYTGRILNIHPALLPAFGGKGMYGHHVHEAVIRSGTKFSGATVHLVDEEYDRGPIVMQDIVPIDDGDTPESLAAKVLRVEHRIYPNALQMFASGRIGVNGLRTFLQP
jgi:formyltetrahydrofolate-dependent phosphoribosylglycinamide formyltransferase